MHLHNCTKFGYASCLNATQNPLCTHQSCRLFHPPPSQTKLHKALVQLQHFLFVCRTPVQNGSMHAVFFQITSMSIDFLLFSIKRSPLFSWQHHQCCYQQGFWWQPRNGMHRDRVKIGQRCYISLPQVHQCGRRQEKPKREAMNPFLMQMMGNQSPLKKKKDSDIK